MLHGTVGTMPSIVSDFYCDMLPATGTVTLDKNRKFNYELATDKRAAVHAGFLISFVYLMDNIQDKIQHLYAAGYRRFIIGGHSQGGALSYLVSAWLVQQRKKGIYEDILVKSYASASPKIGNVYFAYDYDNAHGTEWSFSIINSFDPVPEMPFTTQQMDVDMNEPNPILNLAKRFDELPLLKRIVLKSAFNKMRKRAKRSSEAYQKYLGQYVGKFISQSLPDMQLPEPVNTTYFTRPGVPVILAVNEPYDDYYAGAPNYFHHGVDPYRFLLRQYYDGLIPFKEIVREDWQITGAEREGLER